MIRVRFIARKLQVGERAGRLLVRASARHLYMHRRVVVGLYNSCTG